MPGTRDPQDDNNIRYEAIDPEDYQGETEPVEEAETLVPERPEERSEAVGKEAENTTEFINNVVGKTSDKMEGMITDMEVIDSDDFDWLNEFKEEISEVGDNFKEKAERVTGKGSVEGEENREESGSTLSTSGDREEVVSDRRERLAENADVDLPTGEMGERGMLRERVARYSSPEITNIEKDENGFITSFELHGQKFEKPKREGGGAGKEIYKYESTNKETGEKQEKAVASAQGEKNIKQSLDEIRTLVELQLSDQETGNIVDLEGFFGIDHEGNQVEINMKKLVEDGVEGYLNYLEENDSGLREVYIVEEHLEGADLRKEMPAAIDLLEQGEVDLIRSSVEEMEDQEKVQAAILDLIEKDTEGDRELAEELLQIRFENKKEYLKKEDISKEDIYKKILTQEKVLKKIENSLEESDNLEEVFPELMEMLKVVGDNVNGLSEGHGIGIQNGDVKFQNMAYTVEDGEKIGKVIDYGLSRINTREIVGDIDVLVANGTIGGFKQMAFNWVDEIKEENLRDKDTRATINFSLDEFVSKFFTMDKIARNGPGIEHRNPKNFAELMELGQDKIDANQDVGITLLKEAGVDEKIIASISDFGSAKKDGEATPDIETAWDGFENWYKDFLKNKNQQEALRLVLDYVSDEEKTERLVKQVDGKTRLTSSEEVGEDQISGKKLMESVRKILGNQEEVEGDECEEATEKLYQSLTES